jgi:probable rRNA maturation factor
MGASNIPNTERREATGIEIQVSDTQGHLQIDRPAIVELATRVLSAENRPAASISIALVDNNTIHQLNRLYLGHDWPTDVITFSLSDPDDSRMSGELVVSTEMAVATAREMRGDPQGELALYIVHGLLHLCGYDDSTEEESAAMNRRQAELWDLRR